MIDMDIIILLRLSRSVMEQPSQEIYILLHRNSTPNHRRSSVLAFGGAMASAVARAYNGGLGAVPPAGSRGIAPGQGVRGAESILALGRPTDTANLHPWPVAVFLV